MKKHQLYIDGTYVDPSTGQWLDSVDPYRGEAWARVPMAGKDDVTRAVLAARRAMTNGPWASMAASQRGKVMRRIGDLVKQNADQLAEMDVRDNGKPFVELRNQMHFSAEYWYYYAGLADKLEGSYVPVETPDVFAFTIREPVGVVAALTAWNSPVQFLTIKSAPALAAGCAVVVKPSEFASVSTLEFAGLTKEAGLPDGVFNVLTGLGVDVGAPLVEHPDVAKVTFTGSDIAGTRVYEAAARGMKRVAMELGGKSPNIVFADADLDAAATGASNGIFSAAGQMCIAGSRLLVQNSIKDVFTDKLLDIARRVKLGNPMDSETMIGPISTPPQFAKVLQYVAVAEADGARCILGGKPAVGAGLTGGQFFEPTIFTDVTNDMRIAQEEVFGPLLSIIGFDNEKQAVEIANEIAYGLVAGVWTRSIGRAVRMSKALKAGTIWVNTYRTYSYMLPFGGMKRSGLGREGGIEAINEYLETKSVMMSVAE